MIVYAVCICNVFDWSYLTIYSCFTLKRCCNTLICVQMRKQVSWRWKTALILFTQNHYWFLQEIQSRFQNYLIHYVSLWLDPDELNWKKSIAWGPEKPFTKLKNLKHIHKEYLWILLYVSCSSWQRILGSSTADSRHTFPMASCGTTWMGISIRSYLSEAKSAISIFMSKNTAQKLFL